MSVKTTNLELIKPELTDAADITAMNQNWDIIDEQIGLLKESGGGGSKIVASSVQSVIISFLESDNGKEYRYTNSSGVTSITIVKGADMVLDAETEFHFTIIFKSGTTAPTLSGASIKFTGDDCKDGVFTPVKSKVYELGIWWNGFNLQGVVRGV